MTRPAQCHDGAYGGAASLSQPRVAMQLKKKEKKIVIHDIHE